MSKKLTTAFTGILSGLALVFSGNKTEGTATIISSVIAYIVAEGLIDMASIKHNVKKLDDVIDTIEVRLDDEQDGE